jgi:exonuclease SbcC
VKPMRLSFSGIGPYPESAEIDFNELNTKGIYLIVGPTGAGKTTLFDAMAFALYGKVASDRASDIVSAYDHRHNPKIEFTFSHSNRTYVVHRELALPDKKPIPSQQWLREIGPTGKEINTVTGSKEVSEKCRQLLGLNADEFTQVILLPQGKFQRFLMATGSDKQKILQTIFGTLSYRAIVEELRTTVNHYWSDIQQDRQMIDQQWATIDASLEIIGNNRIISNVPDPHRDLHATVTFLANRFSELKHLELDAKKALAEVTRLHTKAKQDSDRFDKAVRLQALREQHKSVGKLIEVVRERLSAHNAAIPVADSANERNVCEADLKKAEGAVHATRASLKRTAARIKLPSTLTAKFLSTVAKSSPSDLTRELSKLNQTLLDGSASLSELSDLSKQLATNGREHRRLKSRLELLQRTLTERKRSVDLANRRVVEARKKTKGLSTAHSEVSELDVLLEKSDIAGAQRTLKEKTTLLKSAQSRFERAERVWQSDNKLLSQEYAGHLAAALMLNEACPVCGSKAHPRKAKMSRRAVNIAASKTAHDKALEALTNAKRDVREAEKALAVARENAAKLPSPSAQKSIRHKYNELTAIDSSMDDQVKALNEASENLADVTVAASNLKQELAVCVNEGATLTRRHAIIQERVSHIGKLESIKNALKICKLLREHIAMLEKLVARHQTLTGETSNAAAKALSALRKSPFPTEREARAALLNDRERAELTKSAESFDANEIEILKLEAAIGTEPIPKVRPDLEVLGEQVKSAETRFEETSTAVTQLAMANKQIDEARKRIGAVEGAIENKISNWEKAEAITTVFERGAGGPDGQLSLEMWIQRTRFEEVCLVANTQLRELSANRYSLTLEKSEGGLKKSRGSGLDIYVLDSYTGKTRPVQSMSGGEQFIASLALALALAEVVQRHAGGIELPCLFIDEGFGSLDLESLDRAIDVLAKLHASGRTVGIITHVETMQQQLPIGIRVDKTDQGSTLNVLQS